MGCGRFAVVLDLRSLLTLGLFGRRHERAGWRAFLEARGVDDWVVPHSGATAVYREPSVLAAATLAPGIAQVSGLEEAGTLLTVFGTRLQERSRTR
jgi:hypothetical protein